MADNLAGLFAGLQALAKEGKAVFYRIQNGKIAEHWDTIEFIPPRDVWKNANGKF